VLSAASQKYRLLQCKDAPKNERKRESNLSFLALYLVFFLLPFFFFSVALLGTIATSKLSAISAYIISYALVILAYHPKSAQI
jgi:hypothetical protein